MFYFPKPSGMFFIANQRKTSVRAIGKPIFQKISLASSESFATTRPCTTENNLFVFRLILTFIRAVLLPTKFYCFVISTYRPIESFVTLRTIDRLKHISILFRIKNEVNTYFRITFGVPRIELGSRDPRPRILPLNYTPFRNDRNSCILAPPVLKLKLIK
jgi:hypothetical protein